MKKYNIIVYENYHTIDTEEKFYKQLLKIYINKYKIHFIKAIRTRKNFRQFLYRKYKHLVNHKLAELCYWFYNDLHDFPKCENTKCNNKITAFYKFFDAYNRFCSPKCSCNSESTKNARYKTCKIKYGKINPNQFDSKDIKNRLYRQINVYKLLLKEEARPLFSLKEYLDKGITNLNNNELLQWKCTKCNNIFKAKIKFCKNRINGQIHHARCPKCYPLYNFSGKTISLKEKEVLAFIKTIYSGKIIENDRTLMIPDKKYNNWKLNHELDIVLPDIKIAIEFNGSYWHNPIKFPETIKDDNEKIRQCNSLGYILFQINENDWKNNKNLIQKNILNLINTQKILI